MDLVHSPRRRRERGGAPFGLRPHSVPLASKNISLFYRKEDLEKSRLRGRLQLFFINPLCGDFQLSLREFYLSLITSPPYWNKADYGTSKNNLGKIASYGYFLEAIRPVFQECFRALIPGRKICVITANVNQHTDHGLLTFPLATDFAVLLRDIGFVMINEIIWSKDGTGGKWGSYGAQRPIFGSYPYPPNFLFKNVHEYVLIFAKPALTKTKGPKVKIYRDLVAGMERQTSGSGLDQDDVPLTPTPVP